jgi:hypothetical protein
MDRGTLEALENRKFRKKISANFQFAPDSQDTFSYLRIEILLGLGQEE